jgi:uncharacterized protein involved in exopolysaccharide biosynthesis
MGELHPMNLFQRLRTKLELFFMSALSPIIANLASDLATVKQQAQALKDSNSALTADAVNKQIALDAANSQVTALQAQLAQVQAVDPADVDALNAVRQSLADLKASLS